MPVSPVHVGDGDTVVLVEVARGGDMEEDVAIGDYLSIDGFVGSLRELCSSLGDALRSARPDEATVEFGVDVGVESGKLTSLLVKGTGSASLTVTLTWSRPAPAPAG